MTISLQKSDKGTYRQTIRIHQHTLFADVAASLGGDDSAPDPHDLYDASLAACKAITILMYAKRKQIPLESVDIEIERDNSREAKGVYVLNVSLKLNGDLNDEQRQALAAIADKCPIHKLMTAVSTEVHSVVV
ncbi:OsmC family protein [Paraglaciecola hydrolytica]|uniref:Peroxiredoxin n=1 Tax=Paraglaciecola hydrolytica TaxID=1799789 RepID=A0A148KKS4_9ALTE|nr:OsmC family protein [Paraglaciecola hydrolytica]KXI26879.1 peroxiredoxin [Paraglaciecola hydrolytica]